jgi:hypothetical protein
MPGFYNIYYLNNITQQIIQVIGLYLHRNLLAVNERT